MDINSILVKYTWNGDMDMNGKVDADDYFLMDSGFLSGGALKGYRNGDLDYNGTVQRGIVDADDYFLIDSAFLGQNQVLARSAPINAIAWPQLTKSASKVHNQPRRRKVPRGSGGSFSISPLV